jgi:anti-sigma regulatory factor (Ser/Thr protein kinase)
MPRQRRAPPLRVRLSSTYRIEHLDRLFRDLAPVLNLRRRRRIEFDLTGLVSVGPAALAVLAAVLKDLESRHLFAHDSLLLLPRSRSVSNYLQRMDLIRMLAGPGVAEDFERNPPVGFRPCREFITRDECRLVALDLTDALAESCETDSTARASIRICLDELAENVIHHANTPLGGFAVAQGWLRSSRFEIGIADLGVGIRGSLTENPDYADINDDLTAIRTALRPRVTATPERNSGIGLFITKLLLRENGGILLVRSGDGAVYAGVQERDATSLENFPGTLVALRARIDRPLNINSVYRQLEEDDADGSGRENDDQAG